jgi:putative ABC transport system permease protein
VALGAGSGDVIKMVLRHAVLMVGIGVTLGLAGSFALTRVIKSALYNVTATDPATYAGISALLLLVAIVACLIPTRRAVAVHPTIALRYE